MTLKNDDVINGFCFHTILSGRHHLLETKVQCLPTLAALFFSLIKAGAKLLHFQWGKALVSSS